MKASGIARLGLVACTALGSTLAMPQVAFAQSSDDEYRGLTEIIVTAQKREQSVQDVPIAVTAVTADTLAANRIMTVNDLGSIAPGVSVRPSAGGIQVPSFTIRGQNSFGVVPGSDKQVSIYLDGVYISSPRGSIFDLPDVARLEVLRGPQGTLFGRNATAGAVSVVTRDPTGEPGVRAEATIGNYNQYRMRLSADLPQMGPFSGHFSFMRNYKQGDIRNAAAGTVWDRTLSPDPRYGKVKTSPRRLGNIDADSYFAALQFEPSDRFKAVYKFDYNADNGTPEGTAFVQYNPAFPALGPSAGLVAPILNALYTSQNIYLNPGNKSPKTVTNSYVIPRFQRVKGHSLTATWQATDSLTVKNIASYRESIVFSPSSIDGLSALTFTPQALVPFATLSAVGQLGAVFFGLTPQEQGSVIGQFAAGLQGSVGGRMILTASQAASASKQWSNEIQASYTSDRLNLTLGALYFRSKDVSGGPERLQNTVSLTLPPFPANGLFPLGNEGRSFNKATSLAAYVQAEYRFTDQLEAIAGARITKDKKTSRFRWDNRVNGVVLPRPDIVPPAYKDSRPNWLVGLNWKPNDDTLVYAKFSTSFVSGGSVAGITFKPETATSYELGLKTDLFDRRLRANLALFHADYKDFQQPSATTEPAAIAFLNAAYGQIGTLLASNLGTFVQQAHDVRAKGVELELTAAPTTGLLIGGGLAYTDTAYRNISPVFLAAQGGEHKVTVRPKWTGNVYASYETQPLIGDATLSFRVDGLYRSRLVLANNPSVRIAQGIPAQYLSSPGHWRVNARAAIRNIALGGVDAELAVWGKNLGNKRYANSSLFLPWGTASNYDPRRTYGLDLSIRF